MTGERFQGDRACRCHQPDTRCAGLTVRRLSSERVGELAEEIWAASTGGAVPVRPALDPRASRPGASAQAAYQRRRRQERELWWRGWPWRAAALACASAGGGLLAGLIVGAWLGWPMGLAAALLTARRLRFRPSPSARIWRRQAAAQRRTAHVLEPLELEGHLVLHDVTLPGWPASLDHLVVGATGVWVIQSWQHPRPPPRRGGSQWRVHSAAAGPVPELRWEAAAIADLLSSGTLIPVRALLCSPGGPLDPGGRRRVEGVDVVTQSQLPDVIRRGPPLRPAEVERAAARALELLRPAV